MILTWIINARHSSISSVPSYVHSRIIATRLMLARLLLSTHRRLSSSFFCLTPRSASSSLIQCLTATTSARKRTNTHARVSRSIASDDLWLPTERPSALMSFAQKKLTKNNKRNSRSTETLTFSCFCIQHKLRTKALPFLVRIVNFWLNKLNFAAHSYRNRPGKLKERPEAALRPEIFYCCSL